MMTFMRAQGWQDIDLSEESGLRELEKLYDTLQIEILHLIESFQLLRESSGYELSSLYRENPGIIEAIAEEQKEQLQSEIARLQEEADDLKEEIEELDPASVNEIS